MLRQTNKFVPKAVTPENLAPPTRATSAPLVNVERRRWWRDRTRSSALVAIDDQEFFGKTVDISEHGLGLALLERGDFSGLPVRVSVLLGYTYRKYQGRVISTRPLGRWTRLGVQLALSYPPPWWDAKGKPPTWSEGRTLVPNHFGSADSSEPAHTAGLAPTSINFGSRFPLLSKADFQILQRDATEVAAALRSARISEMGCWEERLRAFLSLDKKSPDRPKVCRELFRATMLTQYPVFPGIKIQGRIQVADGSTAQSPGPFIVMLDRFAVACSNAEGEFVARAIAAPPVPVIVPLSVWSPVFQRKQSIDIALGVGAQSERNVLLTAQ